MTYIAFLNAFWRRTVVRNSEAKRFNDTSLSVLQGCPRRGPGKIRFSRKLCLKIAEISKIALLNDPKKFFRKKSQKCSKSFNSKSYLLKIDFPAPSSNFPYYKVVRGHFFEKKIFKNAQNASIRVKNMSRFWKIFLSKCPRLRHFSTKNWTFSFWHFLFIYSLLVTRVD